MKNYILFIAIFLVVNPIKHHAKTHDAFRVMPEFSFGLNSYKFMGSSSIANTGKPYFTKFDTSIVMKNFITAIVCRLPIYNSTDYSLGFNLGFGFGYQLNGKVESEYLNQFYIPTITGIYVQRYFGVDNNENYAGLGINYRRNLFSSFIRDVLDCNLYYRSFFVYTFRSLTKFYDYYSNGEYRKSLTISEFGIGYKVNLFR